MVAFENVSGRKEVNNHVSVIREDVKKDAVREFPLSSEKKIYEKGEEKEMTLRQNQETVEKKMRRIEFLRLRLKEKDRTPVAINRPDSLIIEHEAQYAGEHLQQCYQEGFGIFPSGDPKDSFYNTLWSRDLAHAGGNFFARHNDKAMIQSLETVFFHQQDDGKIPYRVEKKRFLLEHLAHTFGINITLNRKKERPVYEGEDGGNAEDTIPATIAALGELYVSSEKGREFVRMNFDKIEKAMAQFIGRTDPEDGLEHSKKSNPDWSDSLLKGDKKLGTINVWYCRALRMMQLMAEGAGVSDRSIYYRDLEHKVKSSILGTPEHPGKLYDWKNHYFRTGEGENRIDTAASVFGSLYFIPATEAVHVQEVFKAHLMSPSGLKNFYPPYPKERIFPALRRIGMGGYHNEKVWPWVTAQNIQVKIKIAREHPNEQVRDQYKKEAVADLIDQAKLFEEAGGAWEVFDPDTRQKATGLKILGRSYRPPQNLMGNMAAFHSAYSQLKELGWIE